MTNILCPSLALVISSSFNGGGLIDGETTECFWSYLRRLSKMTKQTRRSHSIDILTSGLLYYAKNFSQKLGVF